MKKKAGMIAVILLYAAAAVLITYLIMTSGNYPAGTDTAGYLYKGNMLYDAIRKGDLYPLYDSLWFNGAQTMRYQAPLPIYFLAFCQWIAGGNDLDGYLVFVAFVFYLGALVWLYIGYRSNRPGLGAFLGILWFFMPNNLYVLFGEGDLPQAFALIWMLLWLHWISVYLLEDDWGALVKTVPVFTVIVLSGTGLAVMMSAAMMIFLLIYRLLYHRKGKCFPVVGGMLLAFLITGIWLYASLWGRGNTGSSEVMRGMFQDAWISLNPLRRLKQGNVDFYFGLSSFMVAVFGILCSKRKSMAGFWTALILFAGTTTSVYAVLEKLSAGHSLWMLSFISIALGMILYSFMKWTSLKRGFVILCCVLLVADCVPSFSLIYRGKGTVSANERMRRTADACLITEARKVTTQRAAILDGGSLGAVAPYLLNGYNEKQVKGTFGIGNASAVTAVNIAELEEAAKNGYYLYLFDRALELGNDTVLIQLEELKKGEEDITKASAAAAKLGYQLTAQNDSYLLFHMDTYTSFGTICKYDGIAIGDTAASLTYGNPDIAKGDSVSLDDYTFRELSEYHVIYLSGFTYTDREKAESLVKKLGDTGVKVVISGDGIPEDSGTKERSFLGVSCQDIYFQNGYPVLYTSEGELDTALFDRSVSRWKTVYLNGLEKVDGYLFDSGRRLDFSGSVYNDNIVFVGLNLSYHCFLTQDENVGEYLQQLIGENLNELPDRTIVPLKITYGRNEIRITSDNDNVNTSLAYHDMFSCRQKVSREHNLLVVRRGTTVIRMKYPYLGQGALLTLAGLVGYILLIWWLKYRKERNKVKK